MYSTHPVTRLWCLTAPSSVHRTSSLSLLTSFSCASSAGHQQWCYFQRCRPGRRSSVNCRGAVHFCPKSMYEKLTKFPHFTWFWPKKLTKCPNFTLFLPQNAQILHNNCQKNIFPNFGGHVPPAVQSPTPTYGLTLDPAEGLSSGPVSTVPNLPPISKSWFSGYADVVWALLVQPHDIHDRGCVAAYKVAQKIVSYRTLSISSLNIHQFSQFFHQ